MQQILQKVDQTFNGVLNVVKKDLSTVKTGRAKPDLVAQIPIKVESYGTSMPLRELASVTATDSQTLMISPWDKTIVEDIVRSLSRSELQLNPQEDDDVIRITITPLTHQRRMELVKLVDKKVEAGKRLLREERIRFKKEIDEQKGQPGVSEDDVFTAVEELDRKTHKWEEKINQAGEKKKKEVLTL